SHQEPPASAPELPCGSGQGRHASVDLDELLPQALHGAAQVRSWHLRLGTVTRLGPLERDPVLGHLVLELLLLPSELVQASLLGSETIEGGQLLRELAYGERGAPAQRRIGDVDVREQVVTHVEDLLAREAEIPLDAPGVAAEVGPPRLQAPHLRSEQPILRDHLEERVVAREEIRLAGAHDHEIEQVPPALTRWQETIESVAHH